MPGYYFRHRLVRLPSLFIEYCCHDVIIDASISFDASPDYVTTLIKKPPSLSPMLSITIASPSDVFAHAIRPLRQAAATPPALVGITLLLPVSCCQVRPLLRLFAAHHLLLCHFRHYYHSSYHAEDIKHYYYVFFRHTPATLY